MGRSRALERTRNPRQAAYLLRGDTRGSADIPLEAVRVTARLRETGSVLRIAPFPIGEAGIDRLETLAGALVGVADDSLLQRGDLDPARGILGLEAVDGMPRDRGAELRVTAFG
jgi:hypothetical protein